MEKTKQGVKRSREGWFKKVVRLFDRATIEEGLWEELEELLISADVGVSTTTRLLERVRAKVERDEIRDGSQVGSILKGEMVSIGNDVWVNLWVDIYSHAVFSHTTKWV